MSDLDLEGWTLRELKTENVTATELEAMHQLAGSYEALFSKRSTQIKAQGIEVSQLTEADYKKLILEHYSFLKRPVFLTEETIFIGNSPKTVEAVKAYFDAPKA